jgi:ribonuclease-3
MALDPARRMALRRLEERLGYHFADVALLEQALTHTSCANEDLTGSTLHNEPLEFLGDAVLALLVADLLHRRDPGGPEGEKSRLRSRLVSSGSLARRARDLGLPELLRLGRGEEKTGGRTKASLWADAYEGLVAALYLDGGFEAAFRFVSAEISADLDRVRAEGTVDYKTALQERQQAAGRPIPVYAVVSEEGPSHQRLFRVQCRLDGQPVAEGEGRSKKAAQQDAARQALEDLDGHGGRPP